MNQQESFLKMKYYVYHFVIRVSVNEVKGICLVLNLGSYCKGRPKGVEEQDIYICEYRIDRYAKAFTKIAKKFLSTQKVTFLISLKRD